jgi:hypothetical protein
MKIVGAGLVAVAVVSGNQCTRICVPSNDVIVESLGMSTTGVAVTAVAAFGLHCGAALVAAEVVDGVAGLDADFELLHALRAQTSAIVTAPVRRARLDGMNRVGIGPSDHSR